MQNQRDRAIGIATNDRETNDRVKAAVRISKPNDAAKPESG